MVRPIGFFVLCAGCMILAGCGNSASATTGVSTSLGANSLPVIQPPAYIPGPLNGLSTARTRAMRRPLAVIVENYAPDSRPQTGLLEASTVIETLAEAGVTRFMALYLENDASRVGPVRSTRMYFDDWAAGFHAILAHVGGNDDAQQALWHLPKVFNIDENHWEKSLTDTGTPLFQRSKNRAAPHNMYVNTYSLRNYASQHGQNWPYEAASFPHKQPPVEAHRGHRTDIDIIFTDPLYPHRAPEYAVHYQYDPKANLYRRRMGGVPHVDAGTGKQISPANVVILKTGRAVADKQAGPTFESILIPTLGRGEALFFLDGKVERGVWTQRDKNAPLQLLDRRGKPVSLNPGQTWIEVVPPDSGVRWSTH